MSAGRHQHHSVQNPSFSAPSARVPIGGALPRSSGLDCARIDEVAQNHMELMATQLEKQNGVTEKLKAIIKWNPALEHPHFQALCIFSCTS